MWITVTLIFRATIEDVVDVLSGLLFSVLLELSNKNHFSQSEWRRKKYQDSFVNIKKHNKLLFWKM